MELSLWVRILYLAESSFCFSLLLSFVIPFYFAFFILAETSHKPKIEADASTATPPAVLVVSVTFTAPVFTGLNPLFLPFFFFVVTFLLLPFFSYGFALFLFFVRSTSTHSFPI